MRDWLASRALDLQLQRADVPGLAVLLRQIRGELCRLSDGSTHRHTLVRGHAVEPGPLRVGEYVQSGRGDLFLQPREFGGGDAFPGLPNSRSAKDVISDALPLLPSVPPIGNSHESPSVGFCSRPASKTSAADRPRRA